MIVIQEYSFKRGFTADNARIREVLKKNFPTEITDENGRNIIHYGAFERLTVWVNNKKLYVETESKQGASDEIIMETNKRYRAFLEQATGYTAKERLKKAKKQVEG